MFARRYRARRRVGKRSICNAYYITGTGPSPVFSRRSGRLQNRPPFFLKIPSPRTGFEDDGQCPPDYPSIVYIFYFICLNREPLSPDPDSPRAVCLFRSVKPFSPPPSHSQIAPSIFNYRLVCLFLGRFSGYNGMPYKYFPFMSSLTSDIESSSVMSGDQPASPG